MSKDGIQYPLWTQLGLNQRPSGYEPFAQVEMRKLCSTPYESGFSTNNVPEKPHLLQVYLSCSMAHSSIS
jgi:hypothetical protein